MIKIRSEKDYEIKVVDYKGNLISQFKMPERKRDFLKAMISLARLYESCLLYTSPSPRDRQKSRMPSSA